MEAPCLEALDGLATLADDAADGVGRAVQLVRRLIIGVCGSDAGSIGWGEVGRRAHMCPNKGPTPQLGSLLSA